MSKLEAAPEKKINHSVQEELHSLVQRYGPGSKLEASSSQSGATGGARSSP